MPCRAHSCILNRIAQLGHLFNDDDFHVRRGVSAAARALGASLDNPAPIFDTFLLLTQKKLSIAMRTGILHVVASVTGDISLRSRIGWKQNLPGAIGREGMDSSCVNLAAAVLAMHAERSVEQRVTHSKDAADVALCRAAATLIGSFI